MDEISRTFDFSSRKLRERHVPQKEGFLGAPRCPRHLVLHSIVVSSNKSYVEKQVMHRTRISPLREGLFNDAFRLIVAIQIQVSCGKVLIGLRVLGVYAYCLASRRTSLLDAAHRLR